MSDEGAEFPRSRWASRPLAVDRATVFASHYRAYPVELIATFNPDLVTCEERETVAEMMRRPEVEGFDFLPVLSGGRIIGLFDRARWVEQGAIGDERPIRDLMASLSEGNLIASNTGLLTFICDARQNPCRLVIRDTCIDGIVTISDLQKLPVRPALFLLVTYVELLLADVLRAGGFAADDRWAGMLSESRQAKLDERWTELQKADMNVDKLTASQFCDKREAVLKLVDLALPCSDSRDELKRIEELRNHVAHAGDYAATREAALRTIDTVRLAERWINRLELALADFERKGAAG